MVHILTLIFNLNEEKESVINSVNMNCSASALQGNLQSSEGASFVRGRTSWLVRLRSTNTADRNRKWPNAQSASAEPERSARVKIYSVYSKQARDVLTRLVRAREFVSRWTKR